MKKSDVAMEALIRNNLIEKLTSRGIREAQDGTSIYELSNKSLVRELTISDYQNIDIDNPENRWY